MSRKPAKPKMNHCRRCGEFVNFQKPGALVFADGSVAHVLCENKAPAATCYPHERAEPKENWV